MDIRTPVKRKPVREAAAIQPTAQESPFEFDELFFSVTDQSSRILQANDVFVRISKYEEQEIIGELHKLIRHPDMPRAVFDIFWDHLNAGKAIAAYVKNMAKDGSYYWVMALAFPCKDGFLSVRLKPGSALFDQVRELYAQTLEFEKNKEKELGKKKGMKASKAYLLKQMQKMGFDSYESFMWNALRVEMIHREKVLKNNYACELGNRKGYESDRFNRACSLLNDIIFSLEDLKKIHEALAQNSDHILKLARSLLLLSMNAQIGSAKLDHGHLSLSAIAEKMSEQSVAGEQQILEMQQSFNALDSIIKSLCFNVVSAKLQIEMTEKYLSEIENSNNTSAERQEHKRVVSLLFDAFIPRMRDTIHQIKEIPKHLRDLIGGVKEIERFLMILRFINVSGKVELARNGDRDGAFTNTFHDLITEIERAEKHMAALTSVVQENRNVTGLYEQLEEKLNRHLQHLNDQKREH